MFQYFSNIYYKLTDKPSQQENIDNSDSNSSDEISGNSDDDEEIHHENNKEFNDVQVLRNEIEALADELSQLQTIHQQIMINELELRQQVNQSLNYTLHSAGMLAIPIKVYGLLELPGYSEEICTYLQNEVQNPNFYPFYIINSTTVPALMVDYNDPMVKTITAAYGKDIVEKVITAKREIIEYNSSGHYPVSIMMNSQNSKPLKINEVVKMLNNKLISMNGIIGNLKIRLETSEKEKMDLAVQVSKKRQNNLHKSSSSKKLKV